MAKISVQVETTAKAAILIGSEISETNRTGEQEDLKPDGRGRLSRTVEDNKQNSIIWIIDGKPKTEYTITVTPAKGTLDMKGHPVPGGGKQIRGRISSTSEHAAGSRYFTVQVL